MARDPEIAAHLEWMGHVQPVGLKSVEKTLLIHFNKKLLKDGVKHMVMG